MSLGKESLSSRTGYIDVNDSIDARRAIMALDEDARREGVPVLTGFGLCPGLSTALMMIGAGATGAEKIDGVQVDLRIGANQESGSASIESMFRTIRGEYRVMADGDITEVPRQSGVLQRGIGYECPDIDVVRELFPAVRDYSYHVDFDALSDEKLEKIRTSRVYGMPLVSVLLARLGAVVTSRKARKIGSPQPTELTVTLKSHSAEYESSGQEIHLLQAVGPGSYMMTATIAAATVAAVIKEQVIPGCGDLVDHPELLDPILMFARDAGINIKVQPHHRTVIPLTIKSDGESEGR